MTFSKIVLAGVFSCTAIYLFASAPPPLEDQTKALTEARPLKVENMFNAVNAINDAARTIYTKEIVGPGLKAGLKFGEDWAEPGIEKGPLPALFLRLVAGRMETKPAPLGLYLGSDEPINKSNLFAAQQASAFETIKETREKVFLEQDVAGFVAMYPDIAGAEPCVTCHNDHPDSPKTDWKLNDVMGATTWTYPRGTLGSSEYLDTTEAFFQAVEESYQTYLDKVSGFGAVVPIGADWPGEGRVALPDAQTFMTAVRAQAAEYIVQELVLSSQEKFDSLELETVE